MTATAGWVGMGGAVNVLRTVLRLRVLAPAMPNFNVWVPLVSGVRLTASVLRR